MAEEQQQTAEDWRVDVNESKAPLKIADGESKTFVFLDEGKSRTHPEYGTSIVFEVGIDKEEKSFYVRENNFSLLKQIKELGKLIGTVVTVSRTGSKKTDTRYSIVKAE